MRVLALWVSVIALAVAVPLIAADISYGEPRELKGVTSVYVWQTDPPGMKDAIVEYIRTAVPDLTIAGNDASANVVFMVRRRQGKTDTDGKSFVTTGMVMKTFGQERGRLLMEPVSTKDDQQESLREVTDAFIWELQRANGEKYGKAPPASHAKAAGPRFRSTVGLRKGMSKDQVREAVGSPTRIDGKGGRTVIWWYETTDGATRVVFGGDAIVAVQFIEND